MDLRVCINLTTPSLLLPQRQEYLVFRSIGKSAFGCNLSVLLGAFSDFYVLFTRVFSANPFVS